MRDEKGRFKKGSSGNNKKVFTSKNQPVSKGRKPSRFKVILESLDVIGESLSQEDYKRISAKLLTMTANELKEIAENEETPIAIVLIANAISGDLSNMRIDNMDRLLDRIFGKSTSNVDLTTKGESIKPISKDLAKRIIDELG